MTEPLYVSDLAGTRLREARARRGWNLEQLVARCKALGSDLTVDQLGDMERGRRGRGGKRRRNFELEEWLIVAAALGFPPAWFIVPFDAAESVQVTGSLVAGPEAAATWLLGDAAVSPAGWEPEEGNAEWMKAAAEVNLARNFAQAVNMVRGIATAYGVTAEHRAAVIARLDAATSSMLARGLTPPELPPDVSGLVLAWRAESPLD